MISVALGSEQDSVDGKLLGEGREPLPPADAFPPVALPAPCVGNSLYRALMLISERGSVFHNINQVSLGDAFLATQARKAIN